MPEVRPKANSCAFGRFGSTLSYHSSKASWQKGCLIALLVLPLLADKSFAAKDTNQGFAQQVPMVLQLSPDERLNGEVSKFSDPALDKQIDDLMEIAIEHTGKKEILDQKGKHFSKPLQIAYAWSKDVGELVTEYKGLEQSSEAADVILDTRVKLKSKSAVELAKQMQGDQIHRQIVASVMQIAMGLGIADSKESGTTIDAGVRQLQDLVGEDAAVRTRQFLTDWSKQANHSLPVEKKSSLTILQLEHKSNEVLQASLEKDPIIRDIKGKLSKYNHRSKFARAWTKFLNTTLSITSLSPTVIAPASEVAWTVFVMLNGGPEESKLLKEVYLEKRFESRWQMLNEEARLAVNGYNTATLTQNACMLAVSRFLMAKMSEDPASEQLLSAVKIVPTK